MTQPQPLQPLHDNTDYHTYPKLDSDYVKGLIYNSFHTFLITTVSHNMTATEFAENLSIPVDKLSYIDDNGNRQSLPHQLSTGDRIYISANAINTTSLGAKLRVYLNLMAIFAKWLSLHTVTKEYMDEHFNFLDDEQDLEARILGATADFTEDDLELTNEIASLIPNYPCVKFDYCLGGEFTERLIKKIREFSYSINDELYENTIYTKTEHQLMGLIKLAIPAAIAGVDYYITFLSDCSPFNIESGAKVDETCKAEPTSEPLNLVDIYRNGELTYYHEIIDNIGVLLDNIQFVHLSLFPEVEVAMYKAAKYIARGFVEGANVYFKSPEMIDAVNNVTIEEFARMDYTFDEQYKTLSKVLQNYKDKKIEKNKVLVKQQL
jgi:hypothetical protein